MGLARFLPDCGSKLVRGGGHVLLALALAFCVHALAELGMDEVLTTLSPEAWGIALGVAAAYGLALVLLAIAWGEMAGGAGERRLPIAQWLAVYAPGVIAKYIPGSVFQYGSRQLVGARFRLDQKMMARASLAEAALHAPAALLCAGALVAGSGMGGLAVLLASGCGLLVWGPVPLARATGCQIVFFALFALFAAILAGSALGVGEPSRLAGLFMIAWVAGFLVPVAPGGLGVRESVLLTIAAPLDIAGATLFAFALLTRFATSLGDVGFGLAGYGLFALRRSKMQASS